MRIGFSLAELLISLALLGVIATFTIPKLFQSDASSQQNRYNAIVKNAALMITTGYERYKQAYSVVATTVSATDLTPYLNYITIATSGTIDDTPGGTFYTCSASLPCLKLHNGAILQLDSPQFGGSGTSNTIQFKFDPDGIYTSSSTAQDAPGKSLQLELYYDGYLRTRGTARNPSCHSASCNWPPDSFYDPSWFKGF